MTKDKIVRILINVVVFIAIWALLDWLHARQNFEFKLWDNLIYPIIAGVIVGLIDPVGKMKKK